MIVLHRLNGAIIKLDSNEPSHRRMVTSAAYSGGVMLDDVIKVSVTSMEEIVFQQRDFIVYDERLYFLNTLPKAKMEGFTKYRYDLEFEGGMYELARARFDIAAVAPVYGFDLCGNLHDFCTILVASMNKLNGNSVLWYLDFEMDGNQPVATDDKMLTYEDQSCLAVLQDLVTQWPEWEWKVDVEEGDIDNQGYVGGVLRMRRKGVGSRFSGTRHEMAYGRSGGIASIEKSPHRNETEPNRVYFFGGSRNVMNYRWTRVCLPSAQVGSDSYMQRQVAPANGIYERTVLVDDIYPGNKPFAVSRYVGVTETATNGTTASVNGSTLVLGSGTQTSKVFEFEVYDGTVSPQTGQFVSAREFFKLFGKWLPRTQSSVWGCDYAEWRRMFGADDTEDNRTRYDEYYVGKSCYIATEKPTVTFQTGDCAGMTFTVWNGWTDINEDGEATCTILCVCNDGSPDTRDTEFEVSELEAVQVPNDLLHPRQGDTFIIDGICMPPRYLYYEGVGDTFSAEGQLKDFAEAYMEATANVKDFGVTVSDEWMRRMVSDDPSFALRIYDSVAVSGDFMEEYDGLDMRVVGVEYDMLKVSARLQLSLYYGDSELKIIRNYLKKLT